MKKLSNQREWRLAALVFGMFASGCASTPQGLKNDNEAKRTFEVAESYQTVLKRVVEQNLECRVQTLLPIGQVIFDVQHYPDLREATISSGISGIGTQIHHVISIQGPSAGKTSITTWTNIRPDRFAKHIEKIALGGKGC